MSKIKFNPTTWAEPIASAREQPADNAQVRDDGSRVRFKKFLVTLEEELAADQTVGLCLIPKNARIVDGCIGFDAMGGTAALDLGLAGADGNGYIDDANAVADDPDLFLDGISTVNAGVDTFANFIEGDANPLYCTQKDVILYMTAKNSAYAAGKSVFGYLMYVVD